MNRTLKEATVKRYYYETHGQLRSHLDDFVTAYNFARRLKTLKGLSPYEYVCRTWVNEPQRFTQNPHHQSGTKHLDERSRLQVESYSCRPARRKSAVTRSIPRPFVNR